MQNNERLYVYLFLIGHNMQKSKMTIISFTSWYDPNANFGREPGVEAKGHKMYKYSHLFKELVKITYSEEYM